MVIWLSLKDKLENNPETIEIPGFGKAVVKLPTIKDRLDVKAELKKLPNYQSLTDQERVEYEMHLIALKCLVEPKISLEEYLSSPDLEILSIIGHVARWYGDKLNKIARDSGFLQGMRKP